MDLRAAQQVRSVAHHDVRPLLDGAPGEGADKFSWVFEGRLLLVSVKADEDNVRPQAGLARPFKDLLHVLGVGNSLDRGTIGGAEAGVQDDRASQDRNTLTLHAGLPSSASKASADRSL